MTVMRRLLGLSILATLMWWCAGAAAQAHVLLDAAEPNGDGSVSLTFTFDHGCAGSPTHRLSITMPEGSAVVAADEPPGWQSTISGQTVVWTGPGIPDGVQAEFEMTARLDGDVGSPLLFPAEQECESGDGYAWVDVGESDPEPAPRLVATSAVLDPEFDVSSGTVTSAGASIRDVCLAIGAFAMISAGVAWAVRRVEAVRR